MMTTRYEVATIDEDTAERLVVRFHIDNSSLKLCACLIIPLVVITAVMIYTWWVSMIFGSFLAFAIVVRLLFATRISIDVPEKTIRVDSTFPVAAKPFRTHTTMNFEEVADVLVHNYGSDKAIWLRPRDNPVVIVTRGVSTDQATMIVEQIARRTGARVVEEKIHIGSSGSFHSSTIRF